MTELEPTLSRDEVYRRLPSLECITDTAIRNQVMWMTRRAPEYFWRRPGSYRGYHNGHKHGLWLHTLKVNRAVDVLAPSFQARGVLTEQDVNRAHAAAIVHDQWKNGDDPQNDETDSDHPRVAADIVREHTALDELVARAVEEHMGGFDEEPYPSSQVSLLLHEADMIASDDSIGVSIYEPVPSELREYAHDSMAVDDGR